MNQAIDPLTVCLVTGLIVVVNILVTSVGAFFRTLIGERKGREE